MVKDTISQLVGEALHIDPGTIVQDTDLFAAGLRSLDLVNLVVALEATFGFQFPEEALNRETFASPASITDTVIRSRTICAPANVSDFGTGGHFGRNRLTSRSSQNC